MPRKRNKPMDKSIERLMTELNVSYNSAHSRLWTVRQQNISLDEYIAAGGVIPRIAKHRSEIKEIMQRLGLTRQQATARRYYCLSNNIDIFKNAPALPPVVVIEEIPKPTAHRAVVFTVKDGKWQRASEYEANNYIKTAIFSPI